MYKGKTAWHLNLDMLCELQPEFIALPTVAHYTAASLHLCGSASITLTNLTCQEQEQLTFQNSKERTISSPLIAN